MFLRKFKKPISCFKLKFFLLCFFFSVFSVFSIFDSHFWRRTTKWQRTNINKASNINKIINYNYDIMAKPRYDDILNFPKNYLISSYLSVILSACNIQYNFCLTQVPSWLQNSNFSVVMLTDLIKCNYRLRKTYRSYTCIFSAGLDLIFSNVLKVIFVLSALSALFSVQEITQKYAVTCMGSP